MKKKIIFAVTVAVSTLMLGMTSFAGQWIQGTGEDEGKWWYQLENGGYYHGTYDAAKGIVNPAWRWIDGNHDSVAECYAFDQYGWLYVNGTTPDGYTVDGNGAWVLDGKIQSKGLIQ